MSTTFRVPLILSIALTALIVAATAWVISTLGPGAQIPSHWDADGNVNGYSGTGRLFVLPVLAAILTGVFYGVPRMDATGKLQRARGPFAFAWISAIAFIGVLQAMSLSGAVGAPAPVTIILPLALLVLVAAIANLVWRTHRLQATASP
jgi:hypothetical protein